MKTVLRLGLASALCAATLCGAGRYLEISYPAAEQLKIPVTYTLWIPDGVTRLRAVIVHQHGCGAGAAKGGETAAYDLHWQALARRWNAALLGPSYHQDDKQECRLWSDPRNGSEKAFLKALGELAEKSKHPELATVPWCLWGHSGGGFWVGIMEFLHPERVVAVWFRSGTPVKEANVPEAVYAIPIVCNTGVKEQEGRFQGAWTGCLEWFKRLRAKGAPAAFAPDPRTSHECGDSRYLAIPFFDACLAMRLPASGAVLKPVSSKDAWLGTLLTDVAAPAASYTGDVRESVWLPNARVARAWADYVKTGTVSDATPPRAPFNVRAAAGEITWDAEPDFESGIQAFAIERDGKFLGQVPAKPVGRFGRPLFQTMSYHDTPERPLPEMRYKDTAATGKHTYRVVAINSAGLKSAPSKRAKAR